MYTRAVAGILNNYTSESPAVRAKLYKILNTGKLSGTGKMIISAVDQGFEHGADRSFGINNAAYDPMYHYDFAVKNKLNALAAPLGFLEVVSSKSPGVIPLILKINSSNSFMGSNVSPSQALTATVDDAVRLGCDAIGLTIYPGSNKFIEMITELKDVIKEAKSKGLAVIIWSYVRGEGIKDPMAVDLIAYGAHIACQLGADIVKVKIPNATVEKPEPKKVYTDQKISFGTIADRVSIIVKSCFSGKRMVIFSGGETKDDNTMLNDVNGIVAGGGFGSIVGRNIFQRSQEDAQGLVKKMFQIYTK